MGQRGQDEMIDNPGDDDQWQSETQTGDEIATDTDFNTAQEMMLQDKVACDRHSPA